MRHHLVLKLLALPTALGSALFLLMAAPAQAREITWEAQSAASAGGEFCSVPSPEDKAADSTDQLMNFTAAESDAAVLLFGCDCPSCIGALTQLRNPSLTAAVQSHCWNNLSESEYEQQEIDQILEAVEDANRQGPNTPLISG